MNPLRSLFRYKDVKTFQNPTSLKAAAQAAFGCIGKSAESRAAAHEACTSHAKQQCMPNVPKVHIVEGNVGDGLDPSQTSPASQLQDSLAAVPVDCQARSRLLLDSSIAQGEQTNKQTGRQAG